jgi:hypothetical protein
MRHQSRAGVFDTEITTQSSERCSVCGQVLPAIELGIFDFCSFCGSGILFGPVPQLVAVPADLTGGARP